RRMVQSRLEEVARSADPGLKAYWNARLMLALMGFALDEEKVESLCDWVVALDFHESQTSQQLPETDRTNRPPEALSIVRGVGESGAGCPTLRLIREARRRGLAVRILEEKLDKPLKDEPTERDLQARKHANAAVALLHLGRPARAWQMLGPGSNPQVRTY